MGVPPRHSSPSPLLSSAFLTISASSLPLRQSPAAWSVHSRPQTESQCHWPAQSGRRGDTRVTQSGSGRLPAVGQAEPGLTCSCSEAAVQTPAETPRASSWGESLATSIRSALGAQRGNISWSVFCIPLPFPFEEVLPEHVNLTFPVFSPTSKTCTAHLPVLPFPSSCSDCSPYECWPQRPEDSHHWESRHCHLSWYLLCCWLSLPQTSGEGCDSAKAPAATALRAAGFPPLPQAVALVAGLGSRLCESKANAAT